MGNVLNALKKKGILLENALINEKNPQVDPQGQNHHKDGDQARLNHLNHHNVSIYFIFY